MHTRSTLLAAVVVAGVLTLGATGCASPSAPSASDDTMTFCASLGAQMMVMADMSEGSTPDPAAFAASVEKFRDLADDIADEDPDWSGLGDEAGLFFNHPDAKVRADSYSQLRRYCNEHGLSPFPQDGS
jgi:hypothetical protein